MNTDGKFLVSGQVARMAEDKTGYKYVKTGCKYVKKHLKITFLLIIAV